jgi:hypothetical protein
LPPGPSLRETLTLTRAAKIAVYPDGDPIVGRRSTEDHRVALVLTGPWMTK